MIPRFAGCWRVQKLSLAVGLVAVSAVIALTAGAWSSSSAAAPGPKALEASLLAPCCWGGTLATHDSPLATELRQEVEARADNGESTTSIESDLVGRYGERIRAMPKAGAFSNALVIALDAGILGAAALLVLFARWRRSEPNEPNEPNEPSARDTYDDRIDDELADLSS
jgi:cytochrome c-type biogenesis protein CcmH